MNTHTVPLTIEAAGKLYAPHLTATAIRRLVRSGQIPYRRIGSKYLLTQEAIDNWLRGDPPVKAQEQEQ